VTFGLERNPSQTSYHNLPGSLVLSPHTPLSLCFITLATFVRVVFTLPLYCMLFAPLPHKSGIPSPSTPGLFLPSQPRNIIPNFLLFQLIFPNFFLSTPETSFATIGTLILFKHSFQVFTFLLILLGQGNTKRIKAT
jgi:hypothetical protein